MSRAEVILRIISGLDQLRGGGGGSGVGVSAWA